MLDRFLLSSSEQIYIEDVFSTYLYNGTSAANNKITNNIDLAGKGGLVWLKGRDTSYNNYLTTSSTTTSTLGGTTWLYSNTTDALLGATGNGLCNFFSDGFDINPSGDGINGSGYKYVSWTFRKAPNFFDVVTYTGTGANQNIAHNLGSVPGMILVKRTDTTGDWQVYHRSNANTQYMVLNTTAAVATGATRWNSTTPTASVFTVGTDATVNASGGTYVAYLFAHDTASTGIIQCGSYTGNGSTTGPTVTLGWEPQWVMIKNTSFANDWWMFDNMRGVTTGGVDTYLRANLASPESTTDALSFNATGFSLTTSSGDYNGSGQNYIYIAIRRGPMKTPTLGTSVFQPITYTGDGTNGRLVNTSLNPDMVWLSDTSGANMVRNVFDRLRGNNIALITYGSNAESNLGTYGVFAVGRADNLVQVDTSGAANTSAAPYIMHNFKRTPGFFDTVCYTGTGANQALNHNLGVVPELMIIKGRSGGTSWQVYSSALANTEYIVFDRTFAKATGATRWNSTTPSATTFTVGTASEVNTSAATYVADLFASAPGVSKVGSYTGTGALQTVNCGFTSGARFVLIKRSDSSGDWYLWDSARGISSGNDPYLLTNTTAAEVTGTNYLDTDATGFKVTAAAPAALNAVGGTYIFLAVA